MDATRAPQRLQEALEGVLAIRPLRGCGFERAAQPLELVEGELLVAVSVECVEHTLERRSPGHARSVNPVNPIRGQCVSDKK